MTLFSDQAEQFLDDQHARNGVVGSRRLVAVQTFDIGRLTTHPVPIVPSTFVAVSGEGPKGDSNGSGKTTFLSAVSLLLGDPQWRLEKDGQFASKLLFSPEAAGFGTGFSGFDHGYIVGVFLSEEGADPLTVWVRVGNRPPYVKMRWIHDLHVAHATTEQARIEEADDLWERLPKESEKGSRRLSGHLYGEAPRCLAYLDTPMRPPVPSLLSQQMTSMSPADIGQALISLTGREHMLTGEVEDRRKFAAAADQLQRRVHEDQQSRIDEDAELFMVRQRDQARERLTTGRQYWELHLAAGFLERLEDDRKLEERLEEIANDLHEAKGELDQARSHLQDLKLRKGLEQRLEETKRFRLHVDQRRQASVQGKGRLEGRREELARQRRDLTDAALGDTGVPVEERQSQLKQAEERATSCAAELQLAEERLKATAEHLEQVTEGRDGTVGEALHQLSRAGVQAWGLLDSLILSEDVRPVWEPRLWRFRNAVAVSPEDAERALQELSAHPGLSVVRADASVEVAGSAAPSSVEGVESAVPLNGFLHAIQERYHHETSPQRSADAELGEWVLGGFVDPVTGRESRLTAAHSAHDQAKTSLAQAKKAHGQAREAKEHAQDLLVRAKAAAELTLCKKEITQTEEKVAEAAELCKTLEADWGKADAAYSKAKSALDSHKERVTLAEKAIAQAKEQVKVFEDRHRAVCRERENLGRQRWEQAWQRSVESASALVNSPEAFEKVSRSSDAWRDRALEALNAALSLIAPQTATAPVELTDMIGADLTLSDRLPVGADREVFGVVTGPLSDFLDTHADMDQVLEERIAQSRATRESTISTSQRETASLADALDKTRQMVEGSIERAMRRIRDRFNELDLNREGGYGATLDIDVRAPSELTPEWSVEVTPRWKRSLKGGYISYQRVANGAQIKVFAIQLVLAALLSDDETPGRVLILDELGNSLGDENRKDVLRALQRVAVDKQVTILGTCQDSVIQDAAGHCGQILWFFHASTNDPHNRPTRSWGYDADSKRVERVAYWIRAGRSGPGTMGFQDPVE